MARILFSEIEISVSEDPDEVMSRFVAAKDGLRSNTGVILAPPGWIALTEADTGERVYVQAAHAQYVHHD
jgi:hypothetical protein